MYKKYKRKQMTQLKMAYVSEQRVLKKEKFKNSYLKKRSLFLVNWKTQIQTILKFHLL